MQRKLGKMVANNPTGMQPWFYSAEASRLKYVCNAYKLYEKNNWYYIFNTVIMY